MACRVFNGAIVCGHKVKAWFCGWCGKPATRLCDFPVARNAAAMKSFRPGKTRPRAKMTTCDAPMCDDHRKEIAANVDYCPNHVNQKLAL